MALEVVNNGNPGGSGEIFHREKGNIEGHRPSSEAEGVPGHHRPQRQRKKYLFEMRVSGAEAFRRPDSFQRPAAG